MKLIRYAYSAPTELDRVLGALFPANSRFDGRTETPAVDVFEDADNYHVKVELPGVRKENINATLEDSELTITATRGEKDEKGEAGAEYRRSLDVPEGIDPAKVSAAYENGVLTVTLPKPVGRKPQTITVK